jgi:hypothetical protein
MSPALLPWLRFCSSDAGQYQLFFCVQLKQQLRAQHNKTHLHTHIHTQLFPTHHTHRYKGTYYTLVKDMPQTQDKESSKHTPTQQLCTAGVRPLVKIVGECRTMTGIQHQVWHC